MVTVPSNISSTDNIDTITSKQSDTKSAKAKQSLAGSFDQFLLLLTTQLKNQDPTQPLDTNQITSQIAALAGVEQQVATNENLEKMLAAYTTTQIGGVVGYIGKRAEALGNKSTLEGGYAMFTYDLEEKAAKTTVSISNENGSVVYSGAGTSLAGRNEVYWDGINSLNGQQMPDGVYTLTVKAEDEIGKEIASTTYTTGRVTSVDVQDGQPTLYLGTVKVPIDEVMRIREDPLLVAATQ